MKTELNEERLKCLTRHISKVQEAGTKLAEEIIKADKDMGLAHELIINAHIHDHSKFKGIEWLYLHDDLKEKEPEKFKLALIQHQSTNRHHPEFWSGGISDMPSVYIAEFVCDTSVRSAEFGTDFREWIKGKAAKRFEYSVKGPVYKKIKHFVDLLLDTPFK